MKTIGRRYHLAVGAMATGLIFALGVYLPQMRRLQQLRADTTSLNAQLDVRSQRLKELKSTFEDVGRAKMTLVHFVDAVPENVRIGEFLEEIDRTAKSNGLTDRNVVPSNPIVGEKVSCLPLDITFRGEFDGIFKFLRHMENMQRIARVQRLELVSPEDAFGELLLSMTVHVYFRPITG